MINFQYLFEITTLFTGLVLASQDPPFEYDYFCNEHKTESHADLDYGVIDQLILGSASRTL